MNILEWPECILPSSMSWTLASKGSMFESVFNNATQTVTFPGSKWKVKMSFQDLNDYEARELEALIVELDGMGGRIRLGDFGRCGVPAQGTPVVNGKGQTGKVIKSSGWLPDSLVLERGQYFSINDEMKMVTEDVWTDNNGLADIKFGPMLRTSPKDKATIEVENPMGIFMLSENDNGVDRKPAFSNDFSLSFTEYF